VREKNIQLAKLMTAATQKSNAQNQNGSHAMCGCGNKYKTPTLLLLPSSSLLLERFSKSMIEVLDVSSEPKRPRETPRQAMF
jgi:hypothetical protein